MLYAGSDEGIFRVPLDGDPATAVLDCGRTWRLETDRIDGLLAATETGLYASRDGDDWRRVPVPDGEPSAVAVSPVGSHLYLGTRPAAVYVAPMEDGTVPRDPAWLELSGFRDRPVSDDWGIPRHDGMARVRDLGVHPDAPDRVVAGLEVGGVHVSDDRGTTWAERNGADTDDVHELVVVSPDEFVVATGFGLHRTTDGGRSWSRLDGGGDREYVRSAAVEAGRCYAGVAPGPSPTWNEDDDHVLLAGPVDGDLDPIESPRPDEVAIGWAETDGGLLAATHRGTVLRRTAYGDWDVAGQVPVADRLRGRYLPLAWAAGGP